MFTNEIDFDETKTVIMDDTGQLEDVEFIIADEGVWIRQWNIESAADLIQMSHEMWFELMQALKKEEGFYYTERK